MKNFQNIESEVLRNFTLRFQRFLNLDQSIYMQPPLLTHSYFFGDTDFNSNRVTGLLKFDPKLRDTVPVPSSGLMAMGNE